MTWFRETRESLLSRKIETQLLAAMEEQARKHCGCEDCVSDAPSGCER